MEVPFRILMFVLMRSISKITHIEGQNEYLTKFLRSKLFFYTTVISQATHIVYLLGLFLHLFYYNLYKSLFYYYGFVMSLKLFYVVRLALNFYCFIKKFLQIY